MSVPTCLCVHTAGEPMCSLDSCLYACRRVEMVCGQTPSFSARDKSSTARSLMGVSTSKTTHFTGVVLAGMLKNVLQCRAMPA